MKISEVYSNSLTKSEGLSETAAYPFTKIGNVHFIISGYPASDSFVIKGAVKEKGRWRQACELTLDQAGKSYQVSLASVDKRFQGQGIMQSLYRYLVLEKNISLMSDESLSTGAFKMWYRLSQDPSISVFLFDHQYDDERDHVVDHAIMMPENFDDAHSMCFNTMEDCVLVAQKKGLKKVNTNLF